MTHLPDLYSVARAAKVLKLSPRRVQALIQQRRLPARKVGRAYVISKEDLFEFERQPRRVGRPQQQPAADDPAARAAVARLALPADADDEGE